MPGGHPGNTFLLGLAEDLKTTFGIGHATVQIEGTDGPACHLTPEDVL